MEGTCGGDLWLDQVLGNSGLNKPFIFPEQQSSVHSEPLCSLVHECDMPRTPRESTSGHELKDSGANPHQTEALPLPALTDRKQLLALAQGL